MTIATTKWIASVAGAAGLGLYGQLRNFQQSIVTFTTLNGQTAFIQGVASRQGDERWRFAATMLRLLMVLAIVAAVVVVIGARPFAHIVFGVVDRDTVLGVVLGGLGALLYVGSSISTFILTGNGWLAKSARVQVAGAAGMLLGALLFVGKNSSVVAYGGVILVGGTISLVAGVIEIGRDGLAALWQYSSLQSLRGVWKFVGLSAALAFGGAIGVVTRTFVRALVVNHGGLEAAGYFEAAWTISMTYMGLLLSSLGGYLLPALSDEQSVEGRSRTIDEFLRIALAFGIPLIAGMLVLRELVVRVLYSSQVLPAADLIGLMVVGDYMKLVSWVLVMPMLSSADGRAFIRFEIFFNGIFLLSILGLLALGVPILEAVGLSFAIGYLWNVIAAWWYFQRTAHLELSDRTKMFGLAGGFALVVLNAASRLHSPWIDAALLLPILALSAACLGREGWVGLRTLLRRPAL